MSTTEKKIMVFGAFDHFHKGHRYFLNEAKKLGERLIVVVARDETVLEIKKQAPNQTLDQRIDAIKNEGLANDVVSGDNIHGSWEVLKKHQPDIVALGYDQKKLGEALTDAIQKFNLDTKIVKLSPHEPEKYHSRFSKNPNSLFRISGKIQHGKKEGRKLGFPTINLDLNEKYESGVYAGKAHIHGAEYKAAIFIGANKKTIEAHILDFREQGEFYEEWAIIEINARLRDIIKPKSKEEMREMIEKDIALVRSEY